MTIVFAMLILAPAVPSGEPVVRFSRWEMFDARFDTVEINNSLYQLSGEETIQAWIAVVPAGFFRGQGQPLYHAY